MDLGMMGSSYGWDRRLCTTAGIAAVIALGCVGCRGENETKAAVAGSSVTKAAVMILPEAAVTATPDTKAADITPAKAEEPLSEQLFSYDEYGEGLVVTGIAEEYQDIFRNYMKQTRYRGFAGYEVTCMQIPRDIAGMPVKGIGEDAFAGIHIDELELPDSVEWIAPGAFRETGVSVLELSEGLTEIGSGAFEDCALEYVSIPASVELIDECAFAGNADLWTVLLSDNGTEIEKDAFAGCAEAFLLCYGDAGREEENLVAAYAEANGFDSMEVILSTEPVINYPAEPLVLEPQVRNFFYGDDGDYEAEQWCSWEEDEAAPNFGYSDWQWIGCSSWCGVRDFELEVSASSELFSSNGRYCADNVTIQNRDAAWAEGAAGNGVGESLIYRQSCTCGPANKWEEISQTGIREPVQDGFMRYTEICIVNGYARDEQTWEENGRIKELLMYVEERPYAYLELEDTIAPQYFTLPEDGIKVLSGGMLETRFEITQVYPGSIYEDTCLTGLIMEFSGRYH